MNKNVVVFVSSVFEETRNGPAIYAKYLHEAFTKKNEKFDFVLVTPSRWCQKLGLGFFTYFNVSVKANVACKKQKEQGRNVVCHYNIPANMFLKNKYADVVYIQANDYKQAELYNDVLGKLKQHGLRRMFNFLIRRFIEIKAFKSAKLIIANSNFTARVLKKNYSDNLEFKTIYKAVDLDLFKSLRNSTKGTNEPIKLISVGSDWKTKNFVALIEVINEINLSGKHSLIEVTIVGVSDGEFGIFCSSFNFVKNVGPKNRNELVQILNENEVYVLPSKDEALGVSLLEASAVGLFIIGSNIGGIPEIIENDCSGLLFDPFSKISLKASIEKYLNLDSATKFRFISKSQNNIDKFSLETMVINIRELYENSF